MDRIYVQTNDAERNEVVAFDRAADGKLTAIGHFDTGGRGSGTPHLASQSSVVVSGDRVLVTNAGSDELSLFRVTADGLELAARVPSGGSHPTSVAVHGELVYVLNNGSPGIAGFSLDSARAASRARSGCWPPTPTRRRSRSARTAARWS